MYLCGKIFKTVAMKGNPVEQPSYNSFSELTDEYQLLKVVP